MLCNTHHKASCASSQNWPCKPSRLAHLTRHNVVPACSCLLNDALTVTGTLQPYISDGVHISCWAHKMSSRWASCHLYSLCRDCTTCSIESQMKAAKAFP